MTSTKEVSLRKSSSNKQKPSGSSKRKTRATAKESEVEEEQEVDTVIHMPAESDKRKKNVPEASARLKGKQKAKSLPAAVMDVVYGRS